MKRFLHIVLVVLLAGVHSFAQVLTNAGAAILSSSGALIFVDGEVLNQELETFGNSKTIELINK